MTKLLLYSFCVLLPLMGSSQDDDAGKLKKKWREIHDHNGYRKSESYNGPDADSYLTPTDIDEDQSINQGSSNSRNTPYSGTPYSSSHQQQGRNPGHGPGGNGSLEEDPDITPPEDVDIPEVDAPDIDTPDIDPPSISDSTWKVIGIILLIILLAVILYYILRNRQPSNKVIPFEPLEEDLNPATITKTELELRLEEAMSREDYRECVRIYFLFAMKELIQRRWIFWKKEKTNIHYILEMQGRPTAYEFEEVVSIYDLVWYGDYTIDKPAYMSMQPKLDHYYQLVQRQP